MTHEQSIEALQKQLNDIEADIQAALHSLQGRVVNARVMTHRRRDRPDEHGRPGFYREPLGIEEHIRVVIERADLEKTTGSLNHKNWSSIVHAFMDMGAGCVEDGNKIALRVDDLRNVLRMMHLVQQHLMATAQILPSLPPTPPALPPSTPAPRTETPAAPATTPRTPPAPAPSAPAVPPGAPDLRPERTPAKPLLRKARRDLTPTPAEEPIGPSTMSTEAPYEATQRSTYLDEIRFAEDMEEGEQAAAEEQDDEEDDEEPGPYREVTE